MMLNEECPECLTLSMALAYDVAGLGDVEFCIFCKEGRKINPPGEHVSLSASGRDDLGSTA